MIHEEINRQIDGLLKCREREWFRGGVHHMSSLYGMPRKLYRLIRKDQRFYATWDFRGTEVYFEVLIQIPSDRFDSCL